MHYQNIATIGIVALALAAGGCNRDAGESRDTTSREDRPPAVDRAAELQRDRNEEVSRLDKRVTDTERDYAQANQKVVVALIRDRRSARGVEGRRDQRQNCGERPQDDNARELVGSTRSGDEADGGDIEADVSRLAGKVTSTPPQATTRATGENVSTEPFTSRLTNS